MVRCLEKNYNFILPISGKKYNSKKCFKSAKHFKQFGNVYIENPMQLTNDIPSS